jgi:hypothetical protein
MYFVAPLIKYLENGFYYSNDKYFVGIETTWLFVFLFIICTHILSIISLFGSPLKFSTSYLRFFKLLLILFSLQFLILLLSNLFGLELFEKVNQLGGVKSKSLLGGVYLTLKPLNYWCFVLAFVPGRKLLKPTGSLLYNLLFYLLTIDLVWTSIFSGWKGQIIFLFVPYIIKYLLEKRRLPYKSLVLLLILFVFVIEPIVQMTRVYVSVSNEAFDLSTFTNAIGSFDLEITEYEHSFMGLFRGLVPMGNTILSASGSNQGFLGKNTLFWGLETAIPRFISANKPDQDIGNYLMKNIGNLYDADYYNLANSDFNIAVHLFFEYIANYGKILGFFLCFVSLWIIAIAPVIKGASFRVFSIVLGIKFILLLESPFGGILGVLTREWLFLIIVFLFSKINLNVTFNNNSK